MKRIRGRPKTGKKPVKNVTLDADTLKLLHTLQSSFSVSLGFQMTLTQTIKYLVRLANRKGAIDED